MNDSLFRAKSLSSTNKAANYYNCYRSSPFPFALLSSLIVEYIIVIVFGQQEDTTAVQYKFSIDAQNNTTENKTIL